MSVEEKATDPTLGAARDAEISMAGSASTQTRFSFYNAEEFAKQEASKTKRPPQNRFNFYNADVLQSELTAHPAPAPVLPPPPAPRHPVASTVPLAATPLLPPPAAPTIPPATDKDSVEILRSLQEHEQQRLTILRHESNQLAATSANPYEDAIKEALVLLRKHRTTATDPMMPPITEMSSSSGHEPSQQRRSLAVDTSATPSFSHDDATEQLFAEAQKQQLSQCPPLPAPYAASGNNFDSFPTTPSEPITPGTAATMGETYQAEIEARRKQRQERMARYANRLAELKSETTAVPSGTTPNEGSNNVAEHMSTAKPVDPTQPIVAFPTDYISQVGSGLTVSSREEELHHQQVQLGVERVLLAILDRASSRGRGSQSGSVAEATTYKQEEKKSQSDEPEPSSTSIPVGATGSGLALEEEDALVRAMSDLLRQPTTSLKDDRGAASVDGAELQALDADGGDSSRDLTQASEMGTPKLAGLPAPQQIPAELQTVYSDPRTVHSDPGPEAHAELDRMVEQVFKQSEQLSSESKPGIPQGESEKVAVKPVPEKEEPAKRRYSISKSDSADDESDDVFDSEGEEDTLEYGLEEEDEDDDDDGDDDDSRYGDQSSSESEARDVLQGVLGPLSMMAGGTTGVVLETDSQESTSILGSISAAARNLVAGVSPGSQSEASRHSELRSIDSRSRDGSKRDSQLYELMQTLYAHLLINDFPKWRKKLRNRMPDWDEANPDEPGYRIIRLTGRQLKQMQREYESELHYRKNKDDQFAKDSYERGIKEAQEKVDLEDKRRAALLERDSKFSIKAWSKEFKETDCLSHFPGIKPAGRGEMGDLEFFSLPIIFKSHVTGFEPTKDIYLEAGNVVAGQYLVEGELGSAAFSTAYRCIDLSSEGDGPDGHEEVCLKIIKNTKDFFDQSLDEIKILELLRQTGMCEEMNILQMKTFFYHREHLIIVTELLRQNLFEFGKFITDNDEEPYFTISRLSYITRQCLIALDFVHRIGLVHSDIKPENILLASYSRARVKVIDFGSSCYLTDRQSSYIQSRSYRAPEVVLGLPYDGRIDIWSLGCVVAEMFTGEVTFQNDSVVSMLSRIEAICGPIPKRMIDHGRQSGAFYTSTGLLYEKVKKQGDDDSGSDDSSSTSSASQTQFDIFQPKRTTLSARLGFDADLMANFDAGKHLSREQKRQAIFVDFVRSLLTVDADKRPTAAEALRHPWMEYAETLAEDDIRYP